MTRDQMSLNCYEFPHINYREGQQQTILHPTAGLPLKLSRVGPGWSMDGRPDVAGSGFGGLVGGTLSSSLKKTFQYPKPLIDFPVCFSNGTLNGCPDYVVTQDPMALIVTVGVLTQVS